MGKTPILGKAVATAQQMAAYLLSVNPKPKINIPVETFCRLYLYMGALEGVRGDILFAQSCKETGNFKFKGTVKPEQNNYAGLGTTDVNTPGAYFPDEATGILAQAQHAKGYDGTALNYDCIDPRYEVLVKCNKIGTAKHWEELGGTWAVPGYSTKLYASLEDANEAEDSYGYQIINILNDILSMPGGVAAEDKEPEEKPQENTKSLAGKKICIDAGHYGSHYNKCPAIPEYAESEMAWKLHLMLKNYLEELGAVVTLTRTYQALDKGLYERGSFSEGDDLFLSVHSNAVGSGMNEAVDYVAVYHLVNDATTQCDDISKELAQKLAPVIAEVMGTKQGYKVLTRKSGEDKNGDGVMNDNYYGVLNGARSVGTPGLILEHSFHTNTRTVKWLLDDDNLDRLARAEAECIAGYFTNSKVTIEGTQEKVLYRVQVGAYSVPENAENMEKRLEAAGFDAFIVTVGDLQKVQVGAYSVRENAENMQAKLKAAGFEGIIV